MSFLDSLNALGGQLVDTVGEVGTKYIDAKMQHKLDKKTNVQAPPQTIQPELAAPTPTPPTKGVNSNGETIVAQQPARQPMISRKYLQLGGLFLTAVVGTAFLVRLSR